MRRKIICMTLAVIIVISMNYIPFSATAAGEKEVSIALDLTNTYQEMDGFGFFGGLDAWWSSGSMYSDNWAEMILGDMGVTMWRNEIYPSLPVDEGGMWNKQKNTVQKLAAKAKEKGVDLRIILTVWTPPGAYKVSAGNLVWPGSDGPTRGTDPYNMETNGGTLNPTLYNEYADYIVSALNMYHELGADVYAVSLQNEPYFKQSTFNSCVYTKQWYIDMLNGCVPRIKESYPDIKIFGSENMLNFEADNSFYHTAITNNAQAMSNLDVFAVHGYTDGVLAESIVNHKRLWTTINTKFGSKPNWMTETSGYVDNWLSTGGKPGALDLGMAIGSAIKYGNVSAWVWWQGSGRGTKAKDEYSLMDSTIVGKRYMSSKHYYRFIRPGAERIDSVCEDTDILSTSFYNEDTDTLTNVLVNTSKEDKVITFTGESLPNNYDYFVTTSDVNENVSFKGSVENGSILLPKESIVTVINGDYTIDGETVGVLPVETSGEPLETLTASPKPEETSTPGGMSTSDVTTTTEATPTATPTASDLPTTTATTDPGTTVTKPKSVKLNKKKVTLKVKKSVKLKATLKPKKISAGWTKLTWKSNKPKVAKVNQKGKVTAVKKGTAKITVKTKNKKAAKCTVKVKK